MRWTGTRQGRTEQIQVLDGSSGAVLDTQTISNFHGGEYLTWNVCGHVRFQVTCLDKQCRGQWPLHRGRLERRAGTHIYSNPGTYTATLTATDSAGHTGSASTIVTVNDSVPTVTAESPASGSIGQGIVPYVSVSFNKSMTPSSITTSNFVLKDSNNNTVTATVSYNDNSYAAFLLPSAPLSGSTTYTANISGATDVAGTMMSGPASWSFTTAGSLITLNVPTNHQRIWWTPSRIAIARNWWSTHSFVPLTDGDTSTIAWQNMFAYIITGNKTYGNFVVNLLMNFTISQSSLDGVASDTYRWNDWVPVAYDWCYDLMTSDQVSTFMARYNNYTSIMIAKSFGGPGNPQTDYYWGILCNELNWAIATYYENPMAQTFLNDGLVTRWRNDLLNYFATLNPGGMQDEGTEYGTAMLGYMVIPYTTLGLMGDDLLSQTNWYKEAAMAMIYQTSPAPIGANYIIFPCGADEKSMGAPTAANPWYGDLMTMLANEYATIPIGQYARRWLSMVAPPTTWYSQQRLAVASTDTGGTALSFSGLPVDYYAPGMKFLYTRDSWNSAATLVNLQLGACYPHQDAGTFQIYSGDQQLSVEHTGYSTTFPNGDTESPTLAHSGIVYNSVGEVGSWPRGTPQVLALESSTDFSYAAVNLSDTYHSAYPQLDNTYENHTVREFIFIKPLKTLFVVDRLESTSSSVTKSFLLHTPQSPTIVDGNHVTMVNGDQELRLTTLNSGYSYSVVNEGKGSDDGGGIYRLQDSTSGSLDDVMLHAIQTGPASGSAVNVSITSQDANTWTITFTSALSGTATLVLNKGTRNLGGSFGYAASGTPGLTPLANNIESMTVTDNGPVWDSSTIDRP